LEGKASKVGQILTLSEYQSHARNEAQIIITYLISSPIPPNRTTDEEIKLIKLE